MSKFITNKEVTTQLVICLFLTLATLTAFWQVRNNEFINLDDDLYITNNPNVYGGFTLKGIRWAFTSVHAGHWHPITWISHMLDCNLYGLNPIGHHTTNLLLHITNTLLLFILLLRMTALPWQSGFVAALFALHPLHVESVAWVAERKDLLCAFFWMLTTWTYIYYIQKPRFNRYLLVTISFLFALMSKPMAVTLPFAFLLLDYWPLGRFKLGKVDKAQAFRIVLEKVPLFFLAAALSLFTLLSHWGSEALSSLNKLPLEVRIENALNSYLRYIEKMLWPEGLAVLYPHPMALPFSTVGRAAVLLTILTVLVILVRKRHSYFIVGWLWYLGTLLPVIGLIQAGIQAMADRFTYIPLIGLFIIVVYGISDVLKRWRYRKVALITSGGLLLSMLMILTVRQVQLWQNSVTLFTHTLYVTDNNSLIHNNLGVTLARLGEDEKAIFHYRKALEINPRYSDAHCNLASLLARQGKDQEAISHLLEAIRVRPDKPEAHNDLGVILAKGGKIQEAIAHFSEAIRVNPNYPAAYLNIGIALLCEGRNREAIPYLNEALRLNPREAKVHDNLGVALAATGKTEEAATHYYQALQINPDYVDAHHDLGSLLIRQGKDKEAAPHYHTILRINPSDAQAHYELGVILVRQGKSEEAVGHLTEAVRLLPNYGEAHLALGMLYFELGKKDLAFSQYKILQTINKHLANALYQKISKLKD